MEKDLIVHRELVGKYLIRVGYDQNPENPRDWDNVGVMVCDHPRYQLGDNFGGRD